MNRPVRCAAAEEQRSGAAGRQRSALYSLLARLLAGSLDRPLIDRLRDPAALSPFRQASFAWDETELPRGSVERAAGTLAEEYTRLFVPPAGLLSLHESVHRDSGGALRGPSTVAIRRMINRLGLPLERPWASLPDHVSVELQLMAQLTSDEARVRDKGETQQIQHCLEAQNELLGGQLLRWVLELCNEVCRQTQSPFYRPLSRLTRWFLSTNYIDFVSPHASP